MAPRFEGITDEQWEILDPFLSAKYLPENRGPGKPPSHFRKVINTILWVLLNGAKWKDIPRGSKWGTKSTSHRWLGRWTEDKTWEKIVNRIFEISSEQDLLDLSRGSIDGMFVAGKGGGDDVGYGFKGKGCTVHHLVDNNGRTIGLHTTAANVDERKCVESLLDELGERLAGIGQLKELQADKGYQDEKLSKRLLGKGVTPRISKKRTKKKQKSIRTSFQ